VKPHRVIAALVASALVGLLSVASTAVAPAAVETAPATGAAYGIASGPGPLGTAYEKYVALGDSYSSAPLVPLPEKINAAEQVGFARQARELSRQAARTNLPQAYEAFMNRLRISAQR